MDKTIYINGRFLTQKLSGVQRYAFEISKQLYAFHNYTFILLVPSKSFIKKEYNFTFNINKIGNTLGHRWEQVDLPKYLKKKNSPLLINLTNSAPIFYKNKISTIHDLSFFENNKWFSFKYRVFYKFLVPRIIKTSKKILTVSKYSKKEIMKRYSNLKNDYINVVYNSISFNFSHSKINNNKENYILFIGGNSKRKNLKNLISAFVELDLKKINLKIVGDNVNHLSSDSLDKSTNIEYLGNISDEKLTILYSNAKMLVFPSFYEGFGLPPLEAMSCGCPTIISNLPVLRELYDNAALYIDPNDTKDIKINILKLLNNSDIYDSLVKLGLKQSKKYSWEKSAGKIIDLIKGLS